VGSFLLPELGITLGVATSTSLVIFIPFIGLTFIYAIITPFVYVGLAPIINSLGALLVLYVTI